MVTTCVIRRRLPSLLPALGLDQIEQIVPSNVHEISANRADSDSYRCGISDVKSRRGSDIPRAVRSLRKRRTVDRVRLGGSRSHEAD